MRRWFRHFALPACPREQARAAAVTLSVSERHIYRLLRRCREGGGTLTALVSSGSDGGRGKRRTSRSTGDHSGDRRSVRLWNG